MQKINLRKRLLHKLKQNGSEEMTKPPRLDSLDHFFANQIMPHIFLLILLLFVSNSNYDSWSIFRREQGLFKIVVLLTTAKFGLRGREHLAACVWLRYFVALMRYTSRGKCIIICVEGAMKQERGTCGTFKVLNLTYRHVLRAGMVSARTSRAIAMAMVCSRYVHRP